MPMLVDEKLRLETLWRYDVLDTADEDSFDRITRLASTIVQTPIALISLVDQRRQWFKSNRGMPMRETSREVSFCTHAIRGQTAFMVQDALADPRFCTNPMVIGDPKIRFYLGVPLRMHNGQNIGTLCAMDTTPREPTLDQISMLSDLARMVVDEMELRQLAMTDSLTGALTRRGLEARLQTELERSHRYGRSLSLLAIDLDHFKQVNDTYGHAAGDLLLQSVVAACHDTLRTADVVGRAGGEEFIVLLPETNATEARMVAERLRQTIELLSVPSGPHLVTVTASFGVTTLLASDHTAAQALERADIALYKAKAGGRNRVIVASAAA